MAAPREPVNVIARLVVADQDARGDHVPEILGRLGINGIVVWIGRGVEIDLGLGHMQKAPRLAVGARSRASALDKHVIGRRQDSAARPGPGRSARKGIIRVTEPHTFD